VPQQHPPWTTAHQCQHMLISALSTCPLTTNQCLCSHPYGPISAQWLSVLSITWKCGPLHSMAGMSLIFFLKKPQSGNSQPPWPLIAQPAAGPGTPFSNPDKNQINAISSHVSGCFWLLSCYIQWQDNLLIRTIPHYIWTRNHVMWWATYLVSGDRRWQRREHLLKGILRCQL